MKHTPPARHPAHNHRPLHNPKAAPVRQALSAGFTRREVQQLVAEMLG